MADKTDSQILTACKNALYEIISGTIQSKQIDLGGGKIMNCTMLNLNELRLLVRELESSIGETNNGTFRNPSFAPKGFYRGT